ncbi:MAG TPA: hypothetical protein VFN67_00315 [Polyangiales bacterium]|nr:hypothetical protein [Polyangiales bacterium]
MLARSITVLCLCCLALGACKPKPSKMAACQGDGGCPDASVCEDGAVCESHDNEKSEPGGHDEVAAAGSGGQRARTQAARATPKDAGMSMSADAAQAASPKQASQQPKAAPKQTTGGSAAPKKARAGAGGTGGAGEAMMPMPTLPTTPNMPMTTPMDSEPGQAGRRSRACARRGAA